MNDAPHKPSLTPRSHTGMIWRAFPRNLVGVACLFVIALLVMVALATPVLAPYDPYAQSLTEHLAQPCTEHVLGTDELGFDLLSRFIFGCRVSPSVGVLSQSVALVVGFVLGASAGYLGGHVDAVISFAIQTFSNFPFLLFALVVMYALRPGASKRVCGTRSSHMDNARVTRARRGAASARVGIRARPGHRHLPHRHGLQPARRCPPRRQQSNRKVTTSLSMQTRVSVRRCLAHQADALRAS